MQKKIKHIKKPKTEPEVVTNEPKKGAKQNKKQKKNQNGTEKQDNVKQPKEAKSLAVPMKAKDKKAAKNAAIGKTSLTDKLKEGLKASRFRFLNECLYKSKSVEAVKMFKEDPEAFSVYHEGYRQQVKHWPTNPLNRIIKQVAKL